MLVHDECSIIVPDEEVDEATEYLMKCFTSLPEWAKDKDGIKGIPVDAESCVGQHYSK